MARSNKSLRFRRIVIPLSVFSAVAATLVTTLHAPATPFVVLQTTPVMIEPTPIREPTKVHFLNSTQLDMNWDPFSAAWIQPVSTFLKLDTNDVHNVEGGSFAVFRANRDRVRMAVDWMDLSVEHMSKWWKTLDIFSNPIPYNLTISSFRSYIRNIRVDDNDSTMRDTIAVVAFQPWASKEKPDHKGRTLTVSSLTATMASLRQAGFGRVVVVGYRDGDPEFVQDAFQLLHSSGGTDTRKESRISRDHSPISRVGPMEVGYARATDEEVKSKYTKINLVRGALTGLQSALKGDLDEGRQSEFLGDARNASEWKYVYLTEPDLILQTRPGALPQLRGALDEGLVLCPHRLQPLPHESDVPGMKNHYKVLRETGNISSVIDLDPLQGGVCCDENKGAYKPWEEFGRCVGPFWSCGFNPGRNHSRLEAYSLMRLRPGMGIVSLAGSEHGRRCWPSTKGACPP